MKKERILYIDIIKILAMLLVVLLHCSGEVIRYKTTTSLGFASINFMESITRVAVPLFIMASGAYFLNPKNDISLKSLLKKNIPKIILVLIISSSIMELAKFIIKPEIISTKEFIKSIILGDDILWFFYTLIGLYILTPLLRCITKSKENTVYFLILYFIFTIAAPSIIYFFNLETTKELLSQLSLNFIGGLVGYYVLGYYLDQYQIKKKTKNFLFLAGILGFISTFLLTEYLSIKNGKLDVFYYKNCSITVFFHTIFIFILCKEICKNKKYTNKKLNRVATSTLYIYPIHRLLLIVFPAIIGINTKIHSTLKVPCYAIIIFTISLVFSLLIQWLVQILKNKKKIGYAIYIIILLTILVSFRMIQQDRKTEKLLNNNNNYVTINLK